jgi:hypothetical protein
MEKHADLLGKVIYRKRNWFYIIGFENIGLEDNDQPYFDVITSRGKTRDLIVWSIKRVRPELKPPTKEVKQTVLKIIFKRS